VVPAIEPDCGTSRNFLEIHFVDQTTRQQIRDKAWTTQEEI
jgi:hypothetical protein